MKKSNLKTTGRWFTMLSVLAVLTACAADELVSQGQNQTPGDVETVASGTINFANQTAMTIGTSSAFGQTKAMTHPEYEAFYDNDACELTMPDPEEVTVPEGEELNVGTIDDPFTLHSLTADLVIGGGAVLLDNITLPEGVTIYVKGGVLGVKGSISGGGRIVVLDDGELELVDITTLSNIEIVNYGDFYFYAPDFVDNDYKLTFGGSATVMNYGKLLCYHSYENGQRAEVTEILPLTFEVYGTFMTAGDLTLMEPMVMGDFYVGGNLTCSQLLSASNGGKAHIIGDMNVIGQDGENGRINLVNPLDLCVEGTLTTKTMNISCQANLHIGCKLEITDKLTLDGGAVLCANYIEALNADLGGSSTTPVNIWLPNRGVMWVTNLYLQNSNVIFNLYGSEPGLVQTTSLYLYNGLTDLSGVFGNSFYVNYSKAIDMANYGVEVKDLTFKNPSMVNVATIGQPLEDGCGTDFTAPDPEPEPEPEPETGEIILPIGDLDLEQDFTLLADDFAIRVNGDYLDIVVDGNTATLDNIKILHGDDMVIKVTGLDETNILEGNDYTYECYIWIDNTSPLNDGTGGYGPLFDDELKQEWANPEWDSYDDPNKDNYDYYGVDVTSRITGVESPAGYAVRYNVYRGISGRLETDGNGNYVEGALGDTPYIKVSIHVQRDDDAPANSAVGIYPKIQE